MFLPTTSLTQNVYDAVVVHPQLRQGNIRVEQAEDGKVTLHGKVRTYYLKQLAQETAREVAGVQLIENAMTVEWN